MPTHRTTAAHSSGISLDSGAFGRDTGRSMVPAKRRQGAIDGDRWALRTMPARGSGTAEQPMLVRQRAEGQAK